MKRILLTMLAGLLIGQTASAQSVFSPSVNGLRSTYQSHRAASPDADSQRAALVVTCSVEASAAAIANQLKELGAEIRILMANQLVIDMPLSQLDAAAAIEGVLLIDQPSNGHQNTDTARKSTHADEAQAGKMQDQQDLPHAYTGKGVIIGVLDLGFDFTHPMFKDNDNNLRIKGVYEPWSTATSKSEEMKNIPVVDDKGVSTTINLTGCFFTKPEVILDTTVVMDKRDSHGTHCASIAAGRQMDYTTTFMKKYDTSGKLGGMAPEAELFMAKSGSTEDQSKAHPEIPDMDKYNNMQALWAMKHFAEKQGKPLIISISMNEHDHFHDGTSTMARYIGNFCKQGNIMALCSCNEGGDSMYIGRTISKGKSLKVLCKNTNTSSGEINIVIRSDKEIKFNLAITDLKGNILKDCQLPLTNKGTKEYEKHFLCGAEFDKEGNKIYLYNDDYYNKNGLCKDLLKYISFGQLEISSVSGTGLDKNDKQFTYTHLSVEHKGLSLKSDEDPLATQEYYPMLIITSPEEDVQVHGWGRYFNLLAGSMEEPDALKPGTAQHSMGDWNSTGLPVTIGAYSTDLNDLTVDSETGEKILTKDKDEKIGDIVSFSSYGYDFSDEHRAYPDVTAPGNNIYAAGNSFQLLETMPTATYSNQFTGQTTPRKYPYTTMSGTSMATPAAAGIFALWVQAATENGKKLTNEDIKDIIRHSSNTDDFTKANPLRFGAGKIDAYKGLLYILSKLTSIPEMPTRHIGATLDGRTLHIKGDLDVRVTVYNLSGQLVLDTQSVGGIVNLPVLPAGVYAVKIGTQGSTLIRL